MKYYLVAWVFSWLDMEDIFLTTNKAEAQYHFDKLLEEDGFNPNDSTTDRWEYLNNLEDKNLIFQEVELNNESE